MESDSAQYHTVRSLTQRSVRQFWIFGHFNFPNLRSVIFTAQSPTPRSITLHGVTFFTNIFAKRNILSKTILDRLSGTQMGSIHKKMQKILRHCLLQYCKMRVVLHINSGNTKKGLMLEKIYFLN